MSAPSVLVTRPLAAEDPVARALIAAGMRVHAVPTVATKPVEPGGPLDLAVDRCGAYDWIVVTSRPGANALADSFRRAGTRGVPAGGSAPRIAAVGPGTSAELRSAGLGPSVEPGVARAAAIAGAIAAVDPLPGRRILLARADAAEGDLPALLRAAGALVEEVVAYHTIEAPRASRGGVVAALADPSLAACVVASGSAVRGLVRLATTESGEPLPRLASLPLVSIGPSTSSVVRQLGLSLAGEAAEPTIAAIVEAVLGVVGPARPLRPAAAVALENAP